MRGRFSRALGLFAALVFAGSLRAGTVDELFADGYEDLPDCEALRGTPECPGFALTTDPIPAGTPDGPRAACYFLRAPNLEKLAVRELETAFGTGVGRIVVYATLDGGGAPVERFPPGTIVQDDCETNAAAGSTARRIYQAHEPVDSLTMPFDDGGGDPVAIELAPQQPLAIAVHRTLPDADAATTRVDLVARGLSRGRAYTPTATFVATNVALSIPPGAIGDVESQTCNVPAAVEFWWYSTHAHKQMVLARVQEAPAATTLVESSDWEAPAITEFPAPPFHAYGPGEQLRYECTYANQTGRTITSGTSENTDEQCVAIGYFFPATRPLICVNSSGPF